jgi:hypothetical protein
VQATAVAELFDDELAEKLAFSRRELLEEYRQPHAHPWIIGYSGGKDSTLVVHLVFEMIMDLPRSERVRPVHIERSTKWGWGQPVARDGRSSARVSAMDPIRRISIRARGMSNAATTGRTHVSTQPNAQTRHQFSLASGGASTHVPLGLHGGEHP